MLTWKIKYKDFEGNDQEETTYFNMNRVEAITLSDEFGGPENYEKYINELVESQNVLGLIKLIKRIVGIAYGVRSEDGKRFIKNDKVLEEFEQSLAYEAMFEELTMNPKRVEWFTNGVINIPKDNTVRNAAGGAT